MDDGTARGAETVVPGAAAAVPEIDGVPTGAQQHPGLARPRRDELPRWLARSGWSPWTVVGLLLAAVMVVVALTILLPVLAPVIVAVVLAAVLLPTVNRLSQRRVPRALTAVFGTLLVPALVIAVTAIVVRGLRGEGAQWDQTAAIAGDQLESDLGFDPLTPVVGAVDQREVLLGLASVLASSAAALISFALSLLFALYVLFFLLKDAPRFTDVLVARLPLPPAATQEMLGTARLGMSRYVVGTTVVATMNAVVITLGALVLGLPLILVIALLTFAAAYVPYLGAWVSGTFAVVVALGSGGLDAALWMLAIVLVTNTLLEGVFRPFAFGVALDLHPLAVLAATMVGGALGGLIGVFIAPPVVAIAISWLRIIRGDRESLPEPADEASEQVRADEPATVSPPRLAHG